MQITLNQDEILVALENYVRSQINIATGQEVSIDLKAGRGENGFSATLDIVPAKVKSTLNTGTSIRGSNPTTVVTDEVQAETKPTPAPAKKTSPFKPKAVEKEPEPDAGDEEETDTAAEADEAESTQDEAEDETTATDDEPPMNETAPAKPARGSIFGKAKTA